MQETLPVLSVPRRLHCSAKQQRGGSVVECSALGSPQICSPLTVKSTLIHIETIDSVSNTALCATLMSDLPRCSPPKRVGIETGLLMAQSAASTVIRRPQSAASSRQPVLRVPSTVVIRGYQGRPDSTRSAGTASARSRPHSACSTRRPATAQVSRRHCRAAHCARADRCRWWHHRYRLQLQFPST